jgi:peroxiredoxin Q/BCP
MTKQLSPPTATVELITPAEEAPDFALENQAGQTQRLKDHRGHWVVLYFYPKDHTSGCTKEACQFRDSADQLRERQAVVLGVSPDTAASHSSFADELGLPFDLLADPGSEICSTYGVWQTKSMYGRKYMGVVRTTYLIDPQGRVAHRWDKVKVTNHTSAVLKKMDELIAQP